MNLKTFSLHKAALAVMCMLLCFANAAAQNKTVSGTIVDQAGIPLIGVNVAEKGTLNGAVTDENGKFTIVVGPSAVLQISCIGYVTEEVLPGNGPLNVTLRDDTTMLDDVVVIGYGTARKKDLTGSVVQIRPENMIAENPKTVQDILRGSAGLNVGYSASAKGGGSLSVRGQRSVYTDGGHNDPLLILDGMMFYGELSEINPDDIEQIDILKDASSAAIFGAKAANGVILITIKKGKVGKPVISLSSTVGVTTLADFWHRWDNQDDYLQHYQDWKEVYTYGNNPQTGQWEAYQSGTMASTPGYYSNPSKLPAGVSLDQWRGYTANESGESDLSIWARRLGFNPGSNTLNNLLAGKITNWEDISLRNGFTQDYNASVSGASENNNYYLSFGYMNNNGVRKFDNYKTYRANMKLNTNITKWLEVGANVNFQQRSDGEIGYDDDTQMRQSIFADWKDEEGNYVQYPIDGSYSQRGYNYDFERQYLDLEKGYTTFNTIFDAKVRLPFNITYTFNISPRFQFFYDRYFMSADRPGSVPSDRGVNREQAKRFDWSLNNTLTWDYFFASKHHVTLTLGQEAEDLRYWSDRIEARDILPSDALGFHNTQNGTKEVSQFSTNDTHQSADALFARAFYSYDDRYMITGTIRRDGYSAFGYSNPYAVFPSFGIAWTFTNEK
ncbi:MAG: SusC/RagA family TonB-linked outer membrane protein, partial [Bacteroidales bacterium]|nr:SusC/RagA family TonB-linked outer membrane protein [Bacteroidales bacterium]